MASTMLKVSLLAGALALMPAASFAQSDSNSGAATINPTEQSESNTATEQLQKPMESGESPATGGVTGTTGSTTTGSSSTMTGTSGTAAVPEPNNVNPSESERSETITEDQRRGCADGMYRATADAECTMMPSQE